MIEIPVFDPDGQQVRTERLDEAVLGGHIRRRLLHQAVVMYEANRRVGTRRAKTRAGVAGSGRKMYRQKGTGYARAGSRRSPVRRGGGTAKTIGPQDHRQRMPAKARRRALDSALLGKCLDGEVMIVEGLAFEAPKTRTMRRILDTLGVCERFLLVLGGGDRNTYLSTRNIPGSMVRPVEELNAYDVLRQNRLILTPDAFQKIVDRGKDTRESA